MRRAKNEYFTTKLNECGHDGRKLWRVIKDLLNCKHKEVDKVKVGEEIVSDHKRCADELNTFYVESIIDINNAIEPTVFEDRIRRPVNKLRKFEIPNDDQIQMIAMQLKGKDSIQPNAATFKKAWIGIGPTLCNLVKECFRQKVVPEVFKTSVITPVPKVTNAMEMKDLRPINVLPATDKVIEEIMKIQLLEFIDENNILIEEQAGFREKHSTETALSVVIDLWTTALDKKRWWWLRSWT